MVQRKPSAVRCMSLRMLRRTPRTTVPPTVMLTRGRHLAACHDEIAVLFAADHRERCARRCAIGEIVPSGHYDMVFRGDDTAYGPAQAQRCSLRSAMHATPHHAPHCHADQREASRCIALCKQRAAPCGSPRMLHRTPRPTTPPTVMLTGGRHLAAAPCGSPRALRQTLRSR
jgi:hypothetical protein